MHVRASAIEGLLRLGDTSVFLTVTDLARHPDPSIRAATAQALGATSDKQGLAILQTLLQDQQPQPRLAAAKALGKVSGAVVPWLKRGLQDSDEAVRLTVAGSLIQQLSHPPKPTQRRS
jgi:HEAT repeat protein